MFCKQKRIIKICSLQFGVLFSYLSFTIPNHVNLYHCKTIIKYHIKINILQSKSLLKGAQEGEWVDVSQHCKALWIKALYK